MTNFKLSDFLSLSLALRRRKLSLSPKALIIYLWFGNVTLPQNMLATGLSENMISNHAPFHAAALTFFTFSFSSCCWMLLNQGHSVLWVWAPWSQKDHFRSWKFLESTHIKAHFGADEYLIIFGRTFYRIFLVSYHPKSDWFWGLCLTKRWFELMSKILWRIRGKGKAKCQHLSIAHPFDFKPELSQTKFGRYFPKLVYWAKI